MASQTEPHSLAPDGQLQDKVRRMIDEVEGPRSRSVTTELPPNAKLEISQAARQNFTNHIWPAVRRDYIILTTVLHEFVQDALRKQGIAAQILSRTKELDSASKTLIRREKDKAFEGLDHIINEMHDLSGIRIVLNDQGDDEKVRQFIETTFEQRKPAAHFDRHRKVGEKWDHWFGAYETHNYRVQFRKDVAQLPEHLLQYIGVMFEIQLTTVGDYIYNILAHDYLYKPDRILSRQEEMAIDLSHGLAWCFELVVLMLSPEKSQVGIKEAEMKLSKEQCRGVKDFVKDLEDKNFDKITAEREWSHQNLVDDIVKQLSSILEDRKTEASIVQAFSPDLSVDAAGDFHKKHDASSSRPKFYADMKDSLTDATIGTCQWFLECHETLNWLEEQSQGLLLVTAGPGCGKSVLSKHVIDHVIPANDPNTTVCYFFFKEPSQSSLSQALSSIIHQILKLPCKSHLIRHAKQAVDTNKHVSKSPAELWRIFQDIVKDPDAGSITVVIDALDELEPKDLGTMVRKLQRSLPIIRQGNRVRFLLTGRPYHRVTQVKKDLSPHCVHIDGNDYATKMSEEVKLVANARIAEFASTHGLGDEAQEKIRTRIVSQRSQSDRTYLLVDLVFKYLEDAAGPLKTTAKGVEKKLERLPVTIWDAYEKLLQQSVDIHADKSFMKRAFCILLAAQHSLSLAEFKQAMALGELQNATNRSKDLDLEENNERFGSRLNQSCGLLLSIHEGKVAFLHQTVIDFLLKSPNQDANGWRSSMTIEQAHATMAQICQNMLYLEDFVEEYLEKIGPGQVESPYKDLTVWGRTLLAWLLEMGKATAQSTYVLHLNPYGNLRGKLLQTHPFFAYAEMNYYIHFKRSGQTKGSQYILRLVIFEVLFYILKPPLFLVKLKPHPLDIFFAWFAAFLGFPFLLLFWYGFAGLLIGCACQLAVILLRVAYIKYRRYSGAVILPYLDISYPI